MIALYKPYMPEVPLLDEILHSGQLAYGKYGKEFEELLGKFFGAENLLTTSTFNTAILVALSTLGLRAGDTIIASPMSCLSSTQPIISMGIKIRWADIDAKTGTLSPKSVRSLMGINPKAIIHNHFCGLVGHIDEINMIGKEFGVPVIDDCIEAFGSEYKGRKIGNVGTDVTIFSFGPVRIPNTLDGGAIIFRDNVLFQKALLIRDAGIDRSRFRDDIGEIDPRCDIDLIGYSATMDELTSYIGIQQMGKIDWVLKTQRDNALIWNQLIEPMDNVSIIKNKDGNPNQWVFGIKAHNKRDMIIKFREKGFYASGVHIDNRNYSVFEDKPILEGVDEFNSSFIALPCGWWVEMK